MNKLLAATVGLYIFDFMYVTTMHRSKVKKTHAPYDIHPMWRSTTSRSGAAYHFRASEFTF